MKKKWGTYKLEHLFNNCQFLPLEIFLHFTFSNEASLKYLQKSPKFKPLKVPKREIFDRSDFPDFYTIKSSWVGDLVVKILTYYFNF